jgi:hypothetical protein
MTGGTYSRGKPGTLRFGRHFGKETNKQTDKEARKETKKEANRKAIKKDKERNKVRNKQRSKQGLPNYPKCSQVSYSAQKNPKIFQDCSKIFRNKFCTFSKLPVGRFFVGGFFSADSC